MLVSRSTTKQGNAAIYEDLMQTCGMSLVQVVERAEEYGSVFVVYGYATIEELAAFASIEARIERASGVLYL